MEGSEIVPEIEHPPRAPRSRELTEITFTSPYAPVNGMPRKLTHERCLGHRRSSQSEELTTNGRRPSEGRVRRPLSPQIARAHGRSSPLHPMPLLKACFKRQLKRGF